MSAPSEHQPAAAEVPAWASAPTLFAVLSQAPVPMMLLDADWRVSFVNHAGVTVLGYASHELEGQSIEVVIPEQLRPRYRQIRKESTRRARGAVFLRGERVARTKDGREVLVEIAVSRLAFSEGEMHVATFQDLSAHKRLEQETIERLHSIVEHAEVGIFLIRVGLDGGFTFESFNPVTERLLGLKSEQARGRKPDEVIAAEEAERVTSNYQRCAQLGLPVTYEESVTTVIGGMSFRTTLVPIRDASGRVHRIIGLAHDITGQKQAEQALFFTQKSLRESEERFRKVFSVSPHPIVVSELANGALLEVNDAFERVFGISKGEALGKTTTGLGLWKNPEARSRLVEEIQARGSFRDLDTSGLDRNGRALALLLSGEVIELDGVTCLVTYVHDVTDSRGFQAALARSEERFTKAFMASPDAFVIVDGETGVFLEVNAGFERLFERRREEVIGRTSVEIGLWLDPLVRESARELMLRDNTLRDFEIVAQTPSGETKDCVMSVERLEMEGGWCAVVSIRDVTAARRAERMRAELERQLRQTQKLDALGTLAGGIAHDFNNILGAMLAFAELIGLDVNEPERVNEHLSELKRAGDRAAQLVQQILTFSRKHPASSRRPTEFEATVSEALALVRAGLPSTIALNVELSSRGVAVLADATGLHQVVMNLCTNAAHAMGERQGVLTVRLDVTGVDERLAASHPGLKVGRYARLRVADTGSGMGQDVLKRIFEPFFTTKGPGRGTGLGMAVVHGIVRDHEGVITVASEVDKGTEVTIYLPEYEAGLSHEATSEPALPRGKGERVMLVDDEPLLCQSVAGLLERLGYRVEAFTEPREALVRFMDEPNAFELVLTDLTMPSMTGIDLAREISARSPGKAIVIMSGFGGGHSSESLQTVGVGELLPKPLSALGIATCVRAHLDRAASI